MFFFPSSFDTHNVSRSIQLHLVPPLTVKYTTVVFTTRQIVWVVAAVVVGQSYVALNQRIAAL